jgi:hypothetical protein
MTDAAIPAQQLPADWRDFLALTKPRVMSLVVFTGLCGLLAAPVALPAVLGFTTVLCIALGAGAAGALNQWYEADIDALMKRTAGRPLARRADGPPVCTAFRRGPVFPVGHPAGSCHQLAGGSRAGGLYPVLRHDLHGLAQAPDAAEYRHRRRGRCVSRR